MTTRGQGTQLSLGLSVETKLEAQSDASIPDHRTGQRCGALLIWHNAKPDSKNRLHAWYTLEHHQERLRIEGFISATRWRRITGNAGEFLCLYGVAAVDVLTSTPYTERLANPTPWTQAVMPSFQDMHRTCGEVTFFRQKHRSCYLALAAGMDAENLPSQQLCEAIFRLPDTTACRLITALEKNTSARDPATAESLLRAGADRTVAWALLVETSSPEGCNRLSAWLEEHRSDITFLGTYENIYYATNQLDQEHP